MYNVMYIILDYWVWAAKIQFCFDYILANEYA
jgi:hypothetical protein